MGVVSFSNNNWLKECRNVYGTHHLFRTDMNSYRVDSALLSPSEILAVNAISALAMANTLEHLGSYFSVVSTIRAGFLLQENLSRTRLWSYHICFIKWFSWLPFAISWLHSNSWRQIQPTEPKNITCIPLIVCQLLLILK